MARIETDPNYSSPTFSRATAATDLFKKEDVQALAAAISTHDHSTGKGLSVTAIPNGTITSAMIADATIDTADLKDGSVTSAKIADGTIATADLANASVTNAKLGSDAARANLLTNGGFEVWQRGNGPFTVTGAYTADRWRIALSGADTLSVSRDTTNVDSAYGSQAAAACTFALSGGAGNTTFQEYLAPADTYQLAGRTVTFSVRVRTSTANAVRIGTNVGSWVYGTPHTGDGTWQTLSATVSVPAATTLYVGVSFLASCTAYVDNASLVIGSVAADYAPLHPADDLARCLRYYQRVGPGVFGLGQAASTTSAYVQIPLVARLAVTPTLTVSASSDFTLWLANTTTQAVTSGPGLYGSGTHVIQSNVGVASGLVAGNATWLVGANGNAWLAVEGNP